ncbi:nuclear transport factor 2 family protein [Fulvivirga aurantia]|uniref:nuclear transport factor 2 family protein n=1 Tax=Fulvivirga aurantia TaxID=2529383 RepID=UPI0031B577B7
MENEHIISAFYTAFREGDAERMISFYADDVVFEDPAFGVLQGDEAKNMWRMLLGRATDLQVTYSEVWADGDKGGAHWEAHYTFSKTKRKVHNKIDAEFKLKGGKIIEHRDHFNFWKWSQMALGPFGLFFGYTPFVKSKVRTTAKKALKHYIKNR